MTRTPYQPCRPLASLLVLAALAVPSGLAAVTDPEPAGPFRVRFAVVVGARGDAPLPAFGEVLSGKTMSDYLTQWDPGADNPEIQRIFALRGLSEVLRQAAALPAEGGRLEGGCEIDGVPWRVELEARPAADTVTFRVSVLRAGQPLSEPEIGARWNEKAIVTSSDPDEGRFVFIVVEATRGGGEASPAVAAAAGGPMPKLIESKRPAYPQEERERGASGLVILEIEVDEQGRVAAAGVARGLSAAFDAAALEAVREWRFEPARVQGRPVRAKMQVTINFILE